MDDQSFMQHLRLRISQSLTWFMGATQTREHYEQSDRLQRDGTIRGQQDPDGSHAWRERFQAWGRSQGSQSDAQTRQQQWLDQQQREHQQRQHRGGPWHGR
jgi:hypothetical protein